MASQGSAATSVPDDGINRKSASPLFDVKAHHRDEAAALLRVFPRRRRIPHLVQRSAATSRSNLRSRQSTRSDASGELGGTFGEVVVPIETRAVAEGDGSDGTSSQQPPLSPTSGHEAALESRRVASMRFLRNRNRVVPIATEDLVHVYRLATLQSAQKAEAVEVDLVTRNYRLGWMTQRPEHRPTQWLTLMNMDEGYLDAGGSPADPVTLINSPRSVLTLLRNGQHPMALQRINRAQLRQQMSIVGASADFVAQRFKMLDGLRQNELLSLQAEYQQLCKRLPREQVLTFLELLDHSDLTQLPQVVELEDGTCEVRAPMDDSLAAAMEAINRKAERDRERIQRKLEIEIATSQKVVERHEQQQERNLQAAIKCQQRAAKLAEDKRQEAVLRQLSSKAKTARRAEAVERTEAQRLQAIADRERRTVAVEALAEEARRQRLEARRERIDRTQALRAQRMRQSAAAQQRRDDQRQAQLSEKEAFREAQTRRREVQRAEARAENAHAAHLNAERRAAIVARSEQLLLQREARAEERQRCLEERLQQFEEEKRTQAQVCHLVELRKDIRREESFADAQQREAERMQCAVDRRAAQVACFEAFKDGQQRQRAQRREVEMELRVVKADFVLRNENIRQLEQLQLNDDLIAKRLKCAKMDRVRAALVVRAREEREALNQYRIRKLHTAAAELVEEERASYFDVFRRTTPSALAVLQREREERQARRSKMLLRQHAHDDSSQSLPRCAARGFEMQAAGNDGSDARRPHTAEPIGLD